MQLCFVLKASHPRTKEVFFRIGVTKDEDGLKDATNVLKRLRYEVTTVFLRAAVTEKVMAMERQLLIANHHSAYRPFVTFTGSTSKCVSKFVAELDSEPEQHALI